MNTDYICIESHQALKKTRSDLLCCEQSGREYPIVSGIPLIVAEPRLLLRTFVDSWRQMQSDVETKQGEVEALIPGGLNERLRRKLARELAARRGNLATVSKYLEPLERALADGGEAGADFLFANGFMSGSGPRLEWMLRYFAQDWTNSPDFEAITALFTSAIASHAPDRESVAVLGAGACGVTRAFADMFETTYGVDLSLPTLLVARGALAGDEMALSFEEIGWKTVRLNEPAPSKRPVKLLVADVNRLPFRDGALSVVVTQYLMDLMLDPFVTAREIRRVLKPGGIWLNFSNPMKVPREPAPYNDLDIEDIPAIFGPLGFDVVDSDETRFVLANFAHLDRAGTGSHEKVHRILMRKSWREPLPPEERLELSENPLCWDLVAHRVGTRAVEVARVKSFSSRHEHERFQIGINGALVDAPEGYSDFICALMTQVDGQRSLADIYASLSSRVDQMSRETFIDILSRLRDSYGVLDFQRAAQ